MLKNKKSVISLIICLVFFIGIVATAGLTMAFFGGNASAELESIRLKNALILNASSTAVTQGFTVVPGQTKEIYLTGVVSTNASDGANVGGLVRAKVAIDFDGKPFVGALKINQDTVINGTQVYWNLADDGCYYLVTDSATSTNLYSVEPTTAGVNVTLHLTLGVSTAYDALSSGKNINISYTMTAGQDEIYSDGALLANTISNALPVFTELESYYETVTPNVKTNVYTELEYFQYKSDANIDTGVYITENLGFEIKNKYLSRTSLSMMGGRWNGTNEMCYIRSYQNKIYIRYGTTTYSAICDNNITKPMYLAFNMDGNHIFKVDNYTQQVTPEEFTGNTKFYLLKMVDQGGGTQFGNAATAEFYYVKLYDSGVLVRSYLPCVSPEGVVGVYDLVNNQFSANLGATALVAGPEKF